MSDARFCSQCGAKNAADSVFCTECGIRLSVIDSAATELHAQAGKITASGLGSVNSVNKRRLMKWVVGAGSVLAVTIISVTSFNVVNSSSPVPVAPSPGGLSREDAKLLIQKHPNTTLLFNLNLGDRVRWEDCGERLSFSQREATLKSLEAKGFLSVQVTPRGNSQSKFFICSLTDKGRKDLVFSDPSPKIGGPDKHSDAGTYPINIADRHILAVTGMRFNAEKTNAHADFQYEVRRTNVGESFPERSFFSDYLNELYGSGVREGSATLAIYDDGWRVEAVKVKCVNC